jgi:hypothetical protein
VKRLRELAVGFGALVMAAALLSCVRYARMQTFTSTGTCAGACRHYLACKGDGSDASQKVCEEDCGEIFVDDGEPDRESLREFEGLDCEIAVAFVDGDGGRRDRSAGSHPAVGRRSQAH